MNNWEIHVNSNPLFGWSEDLRLNNVSSVGRHHSQANVNHYQIEATAVTGMKKRLGFFPPKFIV